MQEERQFLETFSGVDDERTAYLNAIEESQQTGKDVKVEIKLPPQSNGGQIWYEFIKDFCAPLLKAGALQEAKEAAAAKRNDMYRQKGVRYSRRPFLRPSRNVYSSLEWAQILSELLYDDLSGQRRSKGFFFDYELLVAQFRGYLTTDVEDECEPRIEKLLASAAAEAKTNAPASSASSAAATSSPTSPDPATSTTTTTTTTGTDSLFLVDDNKDPRVPTAQFASQV